MERGSKRRFVVVSSRDEHAVATRPVEMDPRAEHVVAWMRDRFHKRGPLTPSSDEERAKGFCGKSPRRCTHFHSRCRPGPHPFAIARFAARSADCGHPPRPKERVRRFSHFLDANLQASAPQFPESPVFEVVDATLSPRPAHEWTRSVATAKCIRVPRHVRLGRLQPTFFRFSKTSTQIAMASMARLPATRTSRRSGEAPIHVRAPLWFGHPTLEPWSSSATSLWKQK